MNEHAVNRARPGRQADNVRLDAKNLMSMNKWQSELLQRRSQKTALKIVRQREEERERDKERDGKRVGKRAGQWAGER